MTPEKARELLDGRTPSPWWWCETDYPEVTVYHEKYGIIAKSVDIEEADLICTAPDLAELVAGMHYEYAVECTRDGETWKRETLWGSRFWADSDEECFKQEDEFIDTRIVRRLVGEPEVAE